MKKLEEMSLQELWVLFPIVLVPPDPKWKSYYEEEAARLKSLFSSISIYRISHIGSTAIGSIFAKPIIDILLEVNDSHDLLIAESIIAGAGYLEMQKSQMAIDFNRGYTPKGFAKKVFHLHLRLKGDNRELYFRDYLIDHPRIAKDYETLKLTLGKRYEHDRDAYTAAKTEFVEKYSALGLKAYHDRYK